jgi:hypothetical protein
MAGCGRSDNRGGAQAAADEVDLLERQVPVEPANDVHAPVSGIQAPEDFRSGIHVFAENPVDDPQNDPGCRRKGFRQVERHAAHGNVNEAAAKFRSVQQARDFFGI